MNVVVYMLHSFRSATNLKAHETMKTLSATVLNQFGFMEDNMKSNQIITVFSKDKFEIVYKNNSYYYTNLGIDYPLDDLSALKKLYKENKRMELKPLVD